MSEYKIREAMRLIWYNIPSGASTFSKCAVDGCNEGGRGGGKCLSCSEAELSELTNVSYALKYRKAVRNIRAMEKIMIERFDG